MKQVTPPHRSSSAHPARPIGLGIVGCGELARRAVLPHLAQPDALGIARVAALCGRTLDRVQPLGQQYHVPLVTAEYEALLADDAVEAVLILTPARLHFSQAIAAVRAGKHVYVQKPMTETLQEARTLEREVIRQGVRLVAAPGQVLNPMVARIRESIRSGEIGTPFWAHAPAAAWGGRDLAAETNPAWYFREGAGPFRDRAVYALHLLLALFGPVRRVSAMSAVAAKRRSWGGRAFFVTEPDNVLAQLDFGDGLLATVGAQWCSGGARAQPYQIAVYGLEGSIESTQSLGAWPIAFQLRLESGEAHELSLEPAEVPELAGPHAARAPEVWADLLHLLQCVRSGDTPAAGAAEARQVVEILEAVEQAAKSGETQVLGEAE
jgi:predicted dehydrogenase